MHAPIIRFGLTALLSALSVVSLVAQGARSFADHALYEAVLEQQFKLPDKSKPTESRQTLRYFPDGSGEMQLSIEKETVTLDAAMKEIRVERTSGAVSTQSAVGALLRNGQALQVGIAPLQEFFLHGTDYVIIVESPGRDIRLRAQGPADGERSSDPLVQWMARVRRTLADADLGSLR